MQFNQAYTDLIKQLPPSLVEESWKRLTMRKRNPLSELEVCGIDPGSINMTDQGTKIQNTSPIHICNHEEEINHRVMKNLYILFQKLLDYNKELIEKLNIEKRILLCDIEDKKMQLQ
ncbi:16142_t:CDS:2, partial [Acaulospora colombiana]